MEAALACERAGAHGITVHLREDRRHIQDHDVRALRLRVTTFLNLEMAATDEMLAIALAARPDVVTLVPEKRQERTTEGGLDLVGQREAVARCAARLADAGIEVSLFIDPTSPAVAAAGAIGESNSDSPSSGERKGNSLNRSGVKPGGVATSGLWDLIVGAPEPALSYQTDA